jgi:hypothetical protein
MKINKNLRNELLAFWLLLYFLMVLMYWDFNPLDWVPSGAFLVLGFGIWVTIDNLRKEWIRLRKEK